jgi:hypothetical protein
MEISCNTKGTVSILAGQVELSSDVIDGCAIATLTQPTWRDHQNPGKKKYHHHNTGQHSVP